MGPGSSRAEAGPAEHRSGTSLVSPCSGARRRPPRSSPAPGAWPSGRRGTGAGGTTGRRRRARGGRARSAARAFVEQALLPGDGQEHPSVRSRSRRSPERARVGRPVPGSARRASGRPWQARPTRSRGRTAKNGQVRCIRRRRASPPRVAATASRPVPSPNQPGRFTRACAHENTPGSPGARRGPRRWRCARPGATRSASTRSADRRRARDAPGEARCVDRARHAASLAVRIVAISSANRRQGRGRRAPAPPLPRVRAVPDGARRYLRRRTGRTRPRLVR